MTQARPIHACEGNRSTFVHCVFVNVETTTVALGNYCRLKVVGQKQTFVSNLPFCKHTIFMKSKFGSKKKEEKNPEKKPPKKKPQPQFCYFYGRSG